MSLEPNRYISEPEEYDMSGTLLIDERDDFKTFRVQQIIEGSPASVAGFRRGDIISAVEGKPASNLTLEQLRQMFKRNARKYQLNIRRGDREIRTTIKLKRLI